MEILKVEKLHKSFGDLQVLKGISFSMNEGEVLAVIGASGGGKTTLMRCLTFLEKAQSGKITIGDDCIIDEVDGVSVYPSDEELRIRALKMGLVFQDFHLFPHMNVLGNLTLAPMLVRQLSKEEAVEQAESVLKQVGLMDKINAYPYQLSGGQKQRVAIARALCMDPSILCFDEPTSALDPELTGEVLKVIKSLKSQNVTMLIVTHEINFARDVADNVIFLDNGNILEHGNAKEVINNPKNERTKEFLQRINL